MPGDKGDAGDGTGEVARGRGCKESRSGRPETSIIVNNRPPLVPLASSGPTIPETFEHRQPADWLLADLKNSHEEILGSWRTREPGDLEGAGRSEKEPETPRVHISRAPGSFSAISSPFSLASSKVEIFHPWELICTDWLTSSGFPDRHANPRGFGVAHLYERAHSAK